MKERIKKIRKKLQLTQAAFAEKIGMKQNSIALVESGKRNISDYALRVICREFNVNEEWLRYGEGEIFNPAPASELEALANKYNLSNEAQVLIEKFVNLKPEHQGAVIQFILQVADSLRENEYASASEHSVIDTELSDDERVKLYRQELKHEREVMEKSEALQKSG